MKIYILCDMEGTSGIWRVEQAQSNSPQYQQGQLLLCQDVNAAVDGAFKGGAMEVVVCDTHGGGNNFKIELMDPRATYETPGGGLMMPSLDETFDGLILTGHHAMAGTLGAFLDHTMSSIAIYNFRINSQLAGEIGIETAFAGHYGVPLIMVTGDKAACKEAETQFPGVVTASVKEAIVRNCAKCLAPEKAREIIRKKAREAVGKAKQFEAWKSTLPAEIETEYCRTDYADSFVESHPVGTERINARTIRKKINSFLEVWT